MAVAGTAPIIRAKRSRGVSCAGSKAAASIAATATSITTAACIAAGIGTAAMVIATVRMTTVEHPRVDEGLPYGSPFLLRRSPAARPELLSVLFAKLQRRQRLAEARRLEFRAVIIIILEIDGNPLHLAKRVEDRLVELENAAPRSS